MKLHFWSDTIYPAASASPGLRQTARFSHFVKAPRRGSSISGSRNRRRTYDVATIRGASWCWCCSLRLRRSDGACSPDTDMARHGPLANSIPDKWSIADSFHTFW